MACDVLVIVFKVKYFRTRISVSAMFGSSLMVSMLY